MGSRQASFFTLAGAPAELTAGLDEAGRGCLAGPVVAAAVILPAVFNLDGLADSKKLSANARERLRSAIMACAGAWSVGVVWPRRIEEINILNASLEAMARACGTLQVAPRRLLIDGNKRINEAVLAQFWRHKAPLPAQKAIVHGDALMPAISAASILAKTYRDMLMARLERRWPGYGFAKHKGYGTREHLTALAALGPCPMHRRGFRGVPCGECACRLTG